MLKICRAIDEVRFFELMHVYEEGIRFNARSFYPDQDENVALISSEQDFYQYLSEVFFAVENAFYAVWEINGHYVSALRMEPYKDGLLLEGLETAPDKRGKGYATLLLQQVLNLVHMPVYSHVAKDNIYSIKTHNKCGFVQCLDHAEMIDGKLDKGMFTFLYSGGK